jgi:tetratricopeptide (TPR) repeat protein
LFNNNPNIGAMKNAILTAVWAVLGLMANAQTDTSANVVITDKPGEIEIKFGDSTVNISWDALYAHYLTKGVEKADNGDYEGAISGFNLAQLYKTDDAQLYYNRGLAYHYLHSYQSALNDLNYALELDSNYSMAYNQRGIEKCLLDQQHSSLIDFQHAIDLEPAKGLNYYNMSVAYLQLGDFENACFLLKKALGLGYSQSETLIGQYCH